MHAFFVSELLQLRTFDFVELSAWRTVYKETNASNVRKRSDKREPSKCYTVKNAVFEEENKQR